MFVDVFGQCCYFLYAHVLCEIIFAVICMFGVCYQYKSLFSVLCMFHRLYIRVRFSILRSSTKSKNNKIAHIMKTTTLRSWRSKLKSNANVKRLSEKRAKKSASNRSAWRWISACSSMNAMSSSSYARFWCSWILWKISG